MNSGTVITFLVAVAVGTVVGVAYLDWKAMNAATS